MAANNGKDGNDGNDGKVSLFRKPSTYIAVVAIAVVWQLAQSMFTSTPDCTADDVLDRVKGQVKSELRKFFDREVAATARLVDIRTVNHDEDLDIYICRANIKFGNKGTAETRYVVRRWLTHSAGREPGDLIVAADTRLTSMGH